MLLLQGPFESDYSLAIVNRQLAYALIDIGEQVCLHQRDNTTSYPVSREFLDGHPKLAGLFVDTPSQVDVHSRYTYPPYTDSMTGRLNAIHCYGWEESVFPANYVAAINRDIDLITVMSEYVRRVLKQSGVSVPIVVVGLGADHIMQSPAEPVDMGCGTFDFVHVSSCFPRKAADVLVEAFCKEFRAGESVRLIIKTFPNPHNNIEEIVREASIRYPGHAPIEVWQHPLRPGQMRFVYEQAGCIVAPSRGEGFGLPVAEAMLLGRPVIATAHGGHADICVPGSFWPVEFQIQRANTHLSEQQSYWAEPSLESLRQQMRAVFTSSDYERKKRITIAKTHVSQHFTWRAVAKRHVDACSAQLEEKRAKVVSTGHRKLHIGFISTWNTRCGIAEYTRYLASNLPESIKVSIFADEAEPVRDDERNVVRCWKQSQDEVASQQLMRDLLQRVLSANPDLVSLQFNFGFVPPVALSVLIEGLKTAGIAVFITMHSTQHPNLDRIIVPLSRADLCIVHREADLERLMQAGVQNTVIQRQGILSPAAGAAERKTSTAHDAFVVACFGFFLPPKGIYELLQAFELASRVNDRLRLKLLNALYPNPESSGYAAACLRFIEEAGLGDKVEVWTEFLPEQEILDELSAADLIVLPYTYSTESSSAAIRLPLASLTPILCSDLAIFDEFKGVVHRFPASNPMALANAILDLSADREQLVRCKPKQREHVEELSWKRVADRFIDLADAYVTAVITETATTVSLSYDQNSECGVKDGENNTSSTRTLLMTRSSEGLLFLGAACRSASPKREVPGKAR